MNPYDLMVKVVDVVCLNKGSIYYIDQGLRVFKYEHAKGYQQTVASEVEKFAASKEFVFCQAVDKILVPSSFSSSR